MRFHKIITGTKIFCTGFFFLNVLNGISQQEKFANLFLKYKNASHDSEISTITNKISRYYCDRSKNDSAQYYGAIALRSAINCSNIKKQIAALISIGVSYIYLAHYPDGISYQLRALKLAEQIKDSLAMSKAYNNLGVAYGKIGESNLELDHYKKALKIKLRFKDNQAISTSYINIGGIYNKNLQYDSAIFYLTFGLEYARKEHLKAIEGILYGNIASSYGHKKEFLTAVDYYKKAINIQEAEEDYRGLTYTYGGIGISYIEMNDHKNAEQYLVKCYDLALKDKANDQIMRSAKYLARLYEIEQDFKKAFKYKNEELVYRDSVLNESNTKQTLRLQAKYEFERREQVARSEQSKKDALVKEEGEKQKVVRDSLIGGFIFMIIIGIVILKAYRQKQKSNKLLEMKNVFIEEQNKSVQEKNKDITDSITYAKRIQQAILPSDKTVKKYLPQSFILYKPKDIVAGDFYWMEVISPQSTVGIRKSGLTESRILLAAADCTGHGVPGALVSVVCSNALNRATLEFGITEPGKVLDKTRELVAEIFSKNDEEIRDGMDISLCLIEKEKLFYSGANNPIWIIRKNNLIEKEAVLERVNEPKQNETDNREFYSGTTVKEERAAKIFKETEVIEIKSDKQPIGIYSGKEKPFTTHEVDLQKNDLIYMFTDGFADQFGGPKGKKFKYKSFQELLLQICNLPMNEQKIYLNLAFEKWKGGLEQVDDVLVMGIRV